jgi:hypothetical protein
MTAHPADLLAPLVPGWQKVADRYNMVIYVFQAGDKVEAVTNKSQGVGTLVDTITPRPQL